MSTSVGATRVSCAFVGDEPLVVQCAEIAAARGLAVTVLATNNAAVAEAASTAGLTVVTPGELGMALDRQPADVLLSVAYLHLVPGDVLGRVALAINFHDGPLPGYAGLNATSWALLAGESEHAVTWHVMTDDVDAGEVVDVERFPIASDETGFSLNARCYEAALASFPRLAEALATAGVAVRTHPQPAGERRVFMRHQRPAIVIDPSSCSAGEVERAVRALDLGHRLRNGVGTVRLVAGGSAWVVEGATATDRSPSAAPGTLLAASSAGVELATTDGSLTITAIATSDGVSVDLPTWMTTVGLSVGQVLAPAATPWDPDRERACSRSEMFWLEQLATVGHGIESAGADGAELAHGSTLDAAELVDAVTAAALRLARQRGANHVAIAVADAEQLAFIAGSTPLVRPGVVTVDVDAHATFGELRAAIAASLASCTGKAPLLVDAVGRDPRLRGRRVGADLLVVAAPDATTEAVTLAASACGADLAFAEGRDGVRALAGSPAADAVVAAVASILGDVAGRADAALDSLHVMGGDERALLAGLNATERDFDRTVTLDRAFEAQVARTPEAAALTFGATTVSYRQLVERVEALAGRLAAAGAGHRTRVGIAVPRGIDMVVGVLATLRLGAAYVPLDPTYPADRLHHMVADSGLSVLFAHGAVAAQLTAPGVTVVAPAADDAAATTTPTEAPAPATRPEPEDLAYVIYTSGSTGKPKGVMLEHRQVVNFFAAMDDVIADGAEPSSAPPGTWLSVTSLSFDISVLELLWTLTRGYHVVLKADRGIPIARPAAPTRPVTFSLFYFAAGEEHPDGYRLLLESARFADRHGFEAVWTPERHFHAFGGSYPNPSVTGAALAAITERVAIRAGSVVLPLHSPLRVAEEWAVVDHISGGRVGISFAAGWQPNDFVLNPRAYATAKQDLADNIDRVRQLWRGEQITLPGHDGQPVTVGTLPRPIQPELPIWLTSAGSPATFERAGMLGVNLLTHLLGQSVEQLTENIGRYRAAWDAAGHPGTGRVTLMLHTYLHRDGETARRVAREPMKRYLSTAVGLIRDVASAFPTFAGKLEGTDDLFKQLTADELDQLLEVAADRYLGTSGLFGTPDDALAMVTAVADAGVDEVACLIDFGVPTDDTLAALDLVLETKQRCDASAAGAPVAADAVGSGHVELEDSVAAISARHAITHLQCTPSLAAMLLADPGDRAALATVAHMMVGGEALPAALADELRATLPGRLTNMYGPTETTIWSLVHEIERAASFGVGVPIGRPIANTTICVLDERGRQVPVGGVGELFIGGEGVARGYHERPELTAERFAERGGIGRAYATGDLVSIHADGAVRFGGRADFQVKVRGHRIELGEIESVIDRHRDVVQSVVVARHDGGVDRLVAYVLAQPGADADQLAEAIRQHVAAELPEVMVPSAVMRLDAFPLTPNAKIDRKALPADVPSGTPSASTAAAPPAGENERIVARVWEEALGRAPGRDDNFFDIGGHSLLAVKVFRQLGDATGAKLALTDVFRYPTVRAFAAHLDMLAKPAGDAGDGDAGAAAAAPSAADRAALRRRALGARAPGGGT